MTATEVTLREVQDGDLAVYWEQITDPELQEVAAFTRAYHYDRGAFDAHWTRIRANPGILGRTILADGEVAGHVAAFGSPAEREVTYVLGRAHWGKGIATRALALLLALEPTRPLHADTAADNAGSIRVLEKCGFEVVGTARDFARARGHEIDVVKLVLR
jgi:RimJ/RimL family protein N-acetyltransferase